MSIMDEQVYFVVWTYKDTRTHWNSLQHGYENAVAEAKSLIASGNVTAVWVTVAVNVYKPEEVNTDERGGLEKSLFPRCKEYMNPEMQSEIYDLKAKLADAKALIEASAQIIERSIPFNTLGTMYKPWKEMKDKWAEEAE